MASPTVHDDVHGLRDTTETLLLYGSPAVANGAELTLCAAHDDGLRTGERRAVVHVERHVIVPLLQQSLHTRVGEHGSLHLAAVDATISGEIDEKGLAAAACLRHYLVERLVVAVGLRLAQRLCLRRSKRRHHRARCTEDARGKVHGEGYWD